MGNEVESLPLLEANPRFQNNEDKLSIKLWEETKKISRVCLPAMVFRVTSFGILVVTQCFVGHISSVDLAAYALVQSITIRFINGILLGMSTTTETLCGQAFGAKQYHMLGIYLQRSWVVNIVTATILLPVLIFSSSIYRLLGEEDNISEATKAISLWFIPYSYTLAFTLTINMYLQSQMKNMINGWLSSVVFIVHVLISWLFVDKLDFGIPGAMGAMIITQWGFVICVWVYIFGGWCKNTWTGFSILAFADLIPLIKLSLSSGVMLCLQLWYTSVLVLIAGYSEDAVVEVDAFSICLNVNLCVNMLLLGFMGATSVRVSNELGRGNVEAARFSVKVLVCMSAAVALFFCVLFLAFGDSYPYLFTSDDEVAKSTSKLSTLLAFTMLVKGGQLVFSGVAIGCGSQAKVAIVNLVSYYVVGIPLGCLLAFVAKIGITGIWTGMLIGNVVQLMTLVILTWRMDWKGEVKKTTKRLGIFLHESTRESTQSSETSDHS